MTNLPPRRIAGFEPEALVLGALPDPEGGDVVLAGLDAEAPPGTRVL